MADRLQDLIAGACSPAHSGPDLELNLEICDLINRKLGTFPRIAAMTIVRLVNSRSTNQGMLALSLLDICVKNCGYPFHLQISTKEFLNALVYSFPAQPQTSLSFAARPPQKKSLDIQWNHFDYVPHQPSVPDPVVERVLYMLKEWKVALADRAPYKEDLANINSMYRLLKRRGYRFPELKEESVASLVPHSVLRTPEELEEADNVRLSAKLQEHIRRGTEEDLILADIIMKWLSGYEKRGRPDYRQRFAEQLRGIRSKAIVLYELLESMREGEKIDRAMQDLHNVCTKAKSKIKSILENEETNHTEPLVALYHMLDKVIRKYSDIEKGIYNTQYDIHSKSTEPMKASSSAKAQHQKQPEQPDVSLIDLDDDVTMTNITTPSIGSKPSSSSLFNDNYNNINGSSSTTTNELFDIFGELQQNDTGSLQQQQSSTLFSSTSINTNPYNSTTTSTPTTATRTITSSTLSSSSSSASSLSPPAGHAVDNNNNNNNNDLISHLLHDKNGLQIHLDIYEKIGTILKLRCFFSNQSTAPMETMELQLSAPKSMQINMGRVSSSVIPPKSFKSVFQNITLNNPNDDSLRLRFKVTYDQLGVQMEQTGEYCSSSDSTSTSSHHVITDNNNIINNTLSTSTVGTNDDHLMI
ncbi:hypothetical protein BDA99DRAFT_528066 [Phascolomyces articulosus]|uniref:VHS domain-containing protein n=1 Tax=Phascolomyces articulosus TaxID=60185 RepID=A0AAD5JM68_9FUNG|nr:hypothetical protein BDA99DRAFT_528066 [Phascolomyces articulosus]